MADPVAERGSGGGGGGFPPLFLDQTEARGRAKKKLFRDRAPCYLRVWMTATVDFG